MAIVRGLITLADMRRSVYGQRYSTASTTDDTEFEAYISAATPVIERMTGPMVAESRTLNFDGGRHTIVLPFRYNTVTSITVDGVAWPSYTMDNSAGLIHGGTSLSPQDFYGGTQNVVVVVTVGSATIPPNVVLATREMCRLWWQNGRQADSNAPDEANLTPGIMGRVRALLGASPDVGGFA
jgi:hypothetical protein